MANLGSVKRRFKEEVDEEEKKTVSPPVPPPSRYNLLKRAKYSVDDSDDGLSTLLFDVIQFASPNGPASVQTLAACNEDEVYRHVFELQCYAFLGVNDCVDHRGSLDKRSSDTRVCTDHEKCELKELVGLTVGFSTQAALLTPRHFDRVPIETVRWLVNGHDSMAYQIRQLEPIWVVQRSRVPPPPPPVASTRKETIPSPHPSPRPILPLASPRLPPLQVAASSASPFMSPASTTTPSRRLLPPPSPRLQLLSPSLSPSPLAKATAVTVHIVRHLTSVDPFAAASSSKDDDDDEEEEEPSKKPPGWTLSIMQPSELAVLEHQKIPFSILLSSTGRALREARQQIEFDFRVWKLSHTTQIVQDILTF